jgi:hypothetical protein
LLTHTAIHPRLRQRPADPVGSLGNVWWTEEHDLDLEYPADELAILQKTQAAG